MQLAAQGVRLVAYLYGMCIQVYGTCIKPRPRPSALQRTLESEVGQLAAQGVRLVFAGDRGALPGALARTMAR